MVTIKLAIGDARLELSTDAPLDQDTREFLFAIVQLWFEALPAPPLPNPVLHGALVFDAPIDQPLPSS